MKKFLVILLVLIVLIVVILTAVFFLTSGIAKSADQFFQAVKDNDLDAAYVQLSEDFKASTSREQFESFMRGTALINYKDASWSSRSISGKTGEVKGSVETADGGTIPVTIKFVKEQGKWKIQFIEKAASGMVQETDTTKTIPEDAVLQKMTDESLHEFALAVNNKDFTDLYNTLSALWQSQITPEKLLEIFKEFVDQSVDLTVLSEYEPVYSEKPRINDDGMLELKGYYPTQPSVTYFTLTYLYEHPNWKLAGIHVMME